jgi:TPR repeat protein
MRDGDPEKAFRAAIAVDPNATAAWTTYLFYSSPKWGGSYARIDDVVSRAYSSPLAAIDRKRVAAQALAVKAGDAQLHERYDEAIVQFREAYIAAPEPRYLWRMNRAAKIARDAGQYERAVALYGETLAAAPGNAIALDNRGFVRETKLADFAGALKDYVAAADGGDGWAQNRVGWWYMTGTGGTKDFDAAERYLTKAAAQGQKSAAKNLERLAALKAGPHP